MRKHWSGSVGRGIGLNHLARLRLGKAHFAGHSVDAARLGELCLGEAQLTIFLAQLLADLLFRLDPVTALDGVEVLQPVDHSQHEENHDGLGETAYLVRSRRVGRLDEAAVVKVLGERELRRVHTPTPQSLLSH